MIKNISALLLFFVCIGLSHAEIITFDPAPLPNGSRMERSYVESGVLFSGSFAHGSSSNSGRASNSSSGYLEFLYGSHLRIEMSDSSLFSLGSIDLSEYSTVFIRPKTINFTGYYSNGISVVQSFTTDGLFDSIGGIDDFETFTFDSRFNNLSYVETSTNIFAMDNLQLNVVPEPGSICLFLSGILGLTGLTKKKNP